MNVFLMNQQNMAQYFDNFEGGEKNVKKGQEGHCLLPLSAMFLFH